jgi:hypothetical protein
MDTDCTSDKIAFQGCGSRSVTGRFDGGTITSDAGALLLRELDERFGIIEKLGECFDDYRDPNQTEHTVEQLLRQRIFGLVLGYEDLIDHDGLREDPCLATACGKYDPQGEDRLQEEDKGTPLAGKSTLNRLETGVVDGGPEDRHKKIVCDLAAVEALLIEYWLEMRDEAPSTIVLDLDATDIPLHGDQEEKFYHGYYGHYCYLPLYAFSGEWLLSSLLRFAGQDASADALRPLRMLVDRIQTKWPEARIILRADSGFARDRIMTWCEQWEVDYVLGLAKNDRLKRALASQMQRAKDQCDDTGETVCLYDEFRYETLDTWSKKRRVIAKAEYSPLGPNPRFVVTSLARRNLCPKAIYEIIYCQRGESENRIKELQLDLFADRTSTSSMASNQLRVYFSSVAYLFICLLRRIALAGTNWANAQTKTLRTKLFKIGAQIEVTVRHVWIRMSSAYPHQARFRTIFERVRAGPTAE